MLPKHNLILGKLYRLETLLNGFEILHCSEGLSCFSNKAIFIIKKFMVSEIYHKRFLHFN